MASQSSPEPTQQHERLNLGTSDSGRAARIHIYAKPQVVVVRSPFCRSLNNFQTPFFFNLLLSLELSSQSHADLVNRQLSLVDYFMLLYRDRKQKRKKKCNSCARLHPHFHSCPWSTSSLGALSIIL